MLKEIYTVTTLATKKGKKNNRERVIESRRIMGWFSTIKEAKKSVISNGNGSDIHECYYDYVVIEQSKCGILRVATKEWWFIWEKDKNLPENGHYISTSRPSFLTGLIDFGIG
jgi:hypothetical protein